MIKPIDSIEGLKSYLTELRDRRFSGTLVLNFQDDHIAWIFKKAEGPGRDGDLLYTGIRLWE